MTAGMPHATAVTSTSLCTLRRSYKYCHKMHHIHQFILADTAEPSGFRSDFGYRQSGPFQYNWSVTGYPGSPHKTLQTCLQYTAFPGTAAAHHPRFDRQQFFPLLSQQTGENLASLSKCLGCCLLLWQHPRMTLVQTVCQ